jgi:trigger factor
VAELVDALDLGSNAARRGGSSPPFRTTATNLRKIMQSEASTPSQLEKHLDLAFPLSEVDSEVTQRLKQLARTVKIHGFRPGKVPIKLVAQQYGGKVRQEVMGDSIQRAFSAAVREQNIRVAGFPHFEPKPSPDTSEKFEFTATFEVYPEVAVGDVAALEIEIPVTEVGDEDVARTVEVLRKQRVTYEPVQRGAAPADRVTLDYRGYRDGVQFAGGTSDNQVVVLGEGRLLKDFEAQLLDMAPGQIKTFDLTYPADYHGQEVAGKTATFELTLKQVERPVLPEVNADFARQLGIADGDVDKMRADVRANLEREVKARSKARSKDQVMEGLLSCTQVEVPNALVEIEVNRLMQVAMEDLRARGAKGSEGMLDREIFRAQAKRRVALGLILAEVIRREKLQAKPEQVRSIIEEHAQSFEQPGEMVNWYYQQPERLKEVEAVVLEENVVAWVLGLAKTRSATVSFDDLMGKQTGSQVKPSGEAEQ